MSCSTSFSGKFDIVPKMDKSLADKINALHNDGGEGPGFDGLLPDGVEPPDGSAYSPWQISDSLDELLIPTEAHCWNHNDNYVEWLCLILKEFIVPARIKVTGEVVWDGEDPADAGKIILEDNSISLEVYEPTDDDVHGERYGDFVQSSTEGVDDYNEWLGGWEIRDFFGISSKDKRADIGKVKLSSEEQSESDYLLSKDSLSIDELSRLLELSADHDSGNGAKSGRRVPAKEALVRLTQVDNDEAPGDDLSSMIDFASWKEWTEKDWWENTYLLTFGNAQWDEAIQDAIDEASNTLAFSESEFFVAACKRNPVWFKMAKCPWDAIPLIGKLPALTKEPTCINKVLEYCRQSDMHGNFIADDDACEIDDDHYFVSRWAYLFIHCPQLADGFNDWHKFSGFSACRLLEFQPQFVDRFDMIALADFKSPCWQGCDKELDFDYAWNCLVKAHPEFEKHRRAEKSDNKQRMASTASKKPVKKGAKK